MSYYINKVTKSNFNETIRRITEELKKEGFGIIMEIDMTGTFKAKLDKEFRNYRILGACNPNFAFKALSSEDKIGTLLPCNVIVQEKDNGETEVAAIDPVVSMAAVENPVIKPLTEDLRSRLKRAVNNL